jgi:hypothetical protein
MTPAYHRWPARLRIGKDRILWTPDQRPCITVDDAARLKGMSPWGMRKKVKAKTIEFVVMAGRTFIPVDALERFEKRNAKRDARRR